MWRNFLRWLISVDGSTVVQNLGLGIGSFLGGLVGLGYIIEWFQKLRRQILIGKYLRMYPPTLEDRNFGWELAYDPKRYGHIYLLDHRVKTRHWIANYRTFQDLFRHAPSDEDERKTKLFNEYELKENILTVGYPES